MCEFVYMFNDFLHPLYVCLVGLPPLYLSCAYDNELAGKCVHKKSDTIWFTPGAVLPPPQPPTIGKCV